MASEDPALKRLNPFGLPPETDARFLLLIISGPALVFELSLLLRYTFDPNATSPYTGVPPPPGDLPVDQFFQEEIRYALGLMQASLSSLLLPVLLTALMFLIAAALYRDHPRRIRRQRQASLFLPESDPRFQAELAALSIQAGLPAPPRIEVGRSQSVQDGQAFGVGKRKSLYLDAGLRLLMRKSAERFRAILRHELAHIVNRDIGRTYFAQSLWSAVVLVTILPLLGSTLYLAVSSTYAKIADGLTSADLQQILFEKLPMLFALLLQFAGLILSVLLIRAGLLRTREIYADWRAALWGSGPTLASIFETQSHKGKKGLALFRLHPTPAERLDTLRQPRRLFDLHFDVALIVGIFTSLILNGLIPVAITALTTVGPAVLAFNSLLIEWARLDPGVSIQVIRSLGFLLDFLFIGVSLPFILAPFLLLAPLAAATIGLQVQRQSVADLAEKKAGAGRYLQLLLPALWMGLGMIVGELLTPLAVLAPGSVPNILLALQSVLAFVFFTWLTLGFTRFFSIRLLGSHARAAPPVGKNRFLTVVVAVLFVLVELPLVVGYLFVNKSPDLPVSAGFAILAGLTLVTFLLLVLTFLAAWIVFAVYRGIRPVRCPHCGQPSSRVIVVGASCGRCGKEMAPWVFVGPEG